MFSCSLELITACLTRLPYDHGCICHHPGSDHECPPSAGTATVSYSLNETLTIKSLDRRYRRRPDGGSSAKVHRYATRSPHCDNSVDCRTGSDSDGLVVAKIVTNQSWLSLDHTTIITPLVLYIGVVFSFAGSLSLDRYHFLVLDEFEENAEISVTIKYGSIV